jgi:histidinol-phosphate aminotransferase
MKPLEELVRPNVLTLKAYSSARSEFNGSDCTFLDANENPFGQLNRYPDPQQRTLKNRLSQLGGLPTSQIFIGNGSDEIIDLCYRIFCRPGIDIAITFSPGYGMYDTLACINDVQLIKLPLNDSFQIDSSSLTPYMIDERVKLIIICSPNNPTGNLILDLDNILNSFKGIVLIDEAYIDFADTQSWAYRLNGYPNLIVSQTLSKANALAAARVGIAYASPAIIELLTKVKAPYNISSLNEAAAIQGLADELTYKQQKAIIVAERKRMATQLLTIKFIKRVYPSDANFLLVEVNDADKIYKELVALKIITRNRNTDIKNCIRITIGRPEENERLLTALRTIEQTLINTSAKSVS